jgi:hypothetical protein
MLHVPSMEGLGVVVWQQAMGSTWRRVTGNAELVSIGVSEVGATVVLVVLRPQARYTLRCAAVGQRHSVDLVHQCATFRKESNHLTVATLMRLFVIWLADEEQRPWTGTRLPTGPRTLGLAEAWLDSEGEHQRPVEGKSPIEISDTDKDM